MILEAKRKAAGKELEVEPSKAKTKHEKFINEQIFKEKFINEIKNDERNINEQIFKNYFFFIFYYFFKKNYITEIKLEMIKL